MSATPKHPITTDGTALIRWTDGLGIYGGYKLARSNGRGGKAGSGRNKTATVQVREPMRDGYLLKAQFRYQLDDSRGEHKAAMKARAWIDAQMPNEKS